MNQHLFYGRSLWMLFMSTFFSSGFVIEPHCHNVTKAEEFVYQDASKPILLTFVWNAKLINQGTVGVIFGPVTVNAASKCIAHRAVTVTLATNTKHCPPFSGYEQWCHNETVVSVKNNTNGSLNFTVQFSVQSMVKYLSNVTVNNTVLFSSRLQFKYLSTNESASDLSFQVHILEGPKERENTTGGTLNPCQSSPCLNNGTCEGNMMDLSYDCICMEGFWGSTCEQGGNPMTRVSLPTAKISGKNFTSLAIGISIPLVLLMIALIALFLYCCPGARRKITKICWRLRRRERLIPSDNHETTETAT